MRQSTGPIGMSKGALRTCGVLLKNINYFRATIMHVKCYIIQKQKKGMLSNLFVEHCTLLRVATHLPLTEPRHKSTATTPLGTSSRFP